MSNRVRFFGATVLFAGTMLQGSLSAQTSSRVRVLVDDDWRFTQGDASGWTRRGCYRMGGRLREAKTKGSLLSGWIIRRTFRAGIRARVSIGKNGRQWAIDEVKTASDSAKLKMEAERRNLQADGVDLYFVTVMVTYAQGCDCSMGGQ